MHIQWFPGHMTKALRMMEKNIKVIDSVIYVLDARAPMACINPAFDAVIGSRPVLYIINKSDLIERKDAGRWENFFNEKGLSALSVDSVSSKYSGKIINKLIEINAALIERYKSKGVVRSVRAMVIGVPNTGKSTLINALSGGKKTSTGDRPGITKGKQWIVIDNNIELLDTPGTMSPNLVNQEHAKHLAFIGCINDDILNIEELSLELIRHLNEHHKDLLIKRYGIKPNDSAEEILDAIAVSRGYLIKGGATDVSRASNAVIDDFRKTKIGRIMLEYPDA